MFFLFFCSTVLKCSLNLAKRVPPRIWHNLCLNFLPAWPSEKLPLTAIAVFEQISKPKTKQYIHIPYNEHRFLAPSEGKLKIFLENLHFWEGSTYISLQKWSKKRGSASPICCKNDLKKRFLLNFWSSLNIFLHFGLNGNIKKEFRAQAWLRRILIWFGNRTAICLRETWIHSGLGKDYNGPLHNINLQYYSIGITK